MKKKEDKEYGNGLARKKWVGKREDKGKIGET